MIREFETYHGAVLSRLIHGGVPVQIRTYPSTDNASYIVNDSVGMYIKYSSKRMTPWNFSFQKRHQNELQEMKDRFGSVFLVLVCGDDGLVTLSFEELKSILDEQHEEVEWISVSRRPREKYKVTGSDGKLNHKIGENEFPKKILSALPIKSEKKLWGIFQTKDKNSA